MRVFQYALRQLRRSPGFTIAAISSLALGIGATTAMFTLMDALLLRPLAVREPERLVRVDAVDEHYGGGLPSSLLETIRREAVFDGVCGFLTQGPTVEMAGRISSRWTHSMTGDCFETLGVTPALGRLLEPADDEPGAAQVAVLSYDVWQRDFGGRADVIGEELTIGGEPATVVGVTQRGFRGVQLGFPPDVIFPLGLQYELEGISSGSTTTFARLKRDDSLDQVTARLQTMWPRLLQESVSPTSQRADRERYLRRRLSVTPAAGGLDRFTLRDRFEAPLIALFGIAALVLLVSCVNVANLLLARAQARRGEMSVRLALGASRWVLIRDALAESLIVLVVAVGAGIALAYMQTAFLVSLFGAAFAIGGFALDVTPDARTLLFTCAAAIIAFLLFAVAPASRNSRAGITTLLSGSSRVVGDRAPWRRVLVVAQVALTLALVTGAVLFATALAQLRAMSLGLTAEGMLSMHLLPRPGAYQSEFSRSAYYRDLIERVTHIAGVRDVALSKVLPLSAAEVHSQPISAAGASERQVQSDMAGGVTDGFLRVMGIPLVAGSDFRRSDAPRDVRTVIVSESLARKLFGNRDPLGKQITIGPDPEAPSREIIAVARDAIITNPRARNTLVVYENFWQASPGQQQWPRLLIRTATDPGPITATVRRELRNLGREYPTHVRTLIEERDASLAQERLLASLSMVFGWVGLTLAAVGLYGLLNFSVTRRTGEIGIRMALGADRARILRLVLREAVVLITAGVLIGLPITLAGASAVRALLYGVGPFEILPMAASISVLVLVGLLAAWIPARRAASLAPSVALRQE